MLKGLKQIAKSNNSSEPQDVMTEHIHTLNLPANKISALADSSSANLIFFSFFLIFC